MYDRKPLTVFSNPMNISIDFEKEKTFFFDIFRFDKISWFRFLINSNSSNLCFATISFSTFFWIYMFPYPLERWSHRVQVPCFRKGARVLSIQLFVKETLDSSGVKSNYIHKLHKMNNKLHHKLGHFPRWILEVNMISKEILFNLSCMLCKWFIYIFTRQAFEYNLRSKE